VSGHSSAGRTGRAAASISTTPCIWPDKPIATTCARSSAGKRAAARTSASHHVSGAISAQPGRGDDNGYGSLATARSTPSASIVTSLTEPVPRSMPSRRMTGSGFE